MAMATLHDIDNLGPLDVPSVPTRSPQLRDVMDKGPQPVPDMLKDEHGVWCSAVMARANAKSENRRRLRSTLWAEQCLRRHRRQEHTVLREFNVTIWGVAESASIDYSQREAQVREYA